MISRTLCSMHNNENMRFSTLIPVAFAVCRAAALRKALFRTIPFPETGRGQNSCPSSQVRDYARSMFAILGRFIKECPETV